MLLIDQVPGGYALRRPDSPPTTRPLIVPEDELLDMLAAYFDGGLTNYTNAWDVMSTTAQEEHTHNAV